MDNRDADNYTRLGKHPPYCTCVICTKARLGKFVNRHNIINNPVAKEPNNKVIAKEPNNEYLIALESKKLQSSYHNYPEPLGNSPITNDNIAPGSFDNKAINDRIAWLNSKSKRNSIPNTRNKPIWLSIISVLFYILIVIGFIAYYIWLQ